MSMKKENSVSGGFCLRVFWGETHSIIEVQAFCACMQVVDYNL